MQQAGITPLNPHQMWQFGVEVGGFEAAFFTSASGLSFANDVSEFKPGGSLFNQKTAGRVVFEDLTLKKGKNQEGVDNSILNWQQAIAQVAQGVGSLPSDYFRDLDLVEYDRTGTEIRRYRFFDAFIKSAKLGEYEGGSSEPTIEEVVIAYNRAEQVL